MESTHQVSNIKLSQQLKELGVPQESWHYWQWIEAHKDYELDNGDEENKISAFTVAELGEILPASETETYKVHKNAMDKNWFWECHYDYFTGKGLERNSYIVSSDTEANARAKMLIYLLDNKLIKL
jgi:hypothetical protein